MVENKYEIHTDLPSARGRRFESDERDLSPILITLFGSSWRIGRGWTCDITPHLFVTCSLWLCGRRFFRLGFRCTPKWTPVVSLLDHELLLLPVEEFKEYVVTPMRNWTSPDPTSILAFILLRKGHPRIRSRPKSPSMLRTTKSAKTKQFLIHT